MNKIEEALIGWWGPRCTTFEEDCPCCQAWAEYDGMRAKIDAADKMVAATMECVFDLECYVEHEYGDVLHIPDMFRKYHRDMEPVTTARRAMTVYNEAGR